MLTDRGHEVIHIGVEGSNPVCAEHVSVVPETMWRELYGSPGIGFYNTDDGGHRAILHDCYVVQARKAILERAGDPYTSIVCATFGGRAQRETIAGLNQIVVESGVGYPHTFAKYRAFDSYAWLHYIQGTEKNFNHPSWYDVVIPPACDPEMFSFREEKQDYFLYLGRLSDCKGVHVACHVAGKLGRRLLIVGPGDPTPYLALGSHVSYLPAAGVAVRRDLLASAAALICPTIYLEPFGCIAVEAAMSGTPVISTDWGGFTESVEHGITGWRCRTLDHFIWAGKHIDRIQPRDCRRWAISNYSLSPISAKFDEWFQMLSDLNSETGWSTERDSRRKLDWLTVMR